MRRLLGNLLLNEPPDEFEADSRNFGNSLEGTWKSMPRTQWPNLLAVAYELAYETAHHHPELHGRVFVVDQVKLWLSPTIEGHKQTIVPVRAALRQLTGSQRPDSPSADG